MEWPFRTTFFSLSGTYCGRITRHWLKASPMDQTMSDAWLKSFHISLFTFILLANHQLAIISFLSLVCVPVGEPVIINVLQRNCPLQRLFFLMAPSLLKEIKEYRNLQ